MQACGACIGVKPRSSCKRKYTCIAVLMKCVSRVGASTAAMDECTSDPMHMTANDWFKQHQTRSDELLHCFDAIRSKVTLLGALHTVSQLHRAPLELHVDIGGDDNPALWLNQDVQLHHLVLARGDNYTLISFTHDDSHLISRKVDKTDIFQGIEADKVDGCLWDMKACSLFADPRCCRLLEVSHADLACFGTAADRHVKFKDCMMRTAEVVRELKDMQDAEVARSAGHGAGKRGPLPWVYCRAAQLLVESGSTHRLISGLAGNVQEQCDVARCGIAISRLLNYNVIHTCVSRCSNVSSAVILLVLIVIWVNALGVIADDYLVPVLAEMGRKLQISDALSGATLLALGSAVNESMVGLVAALGAWKGRDGSISDVDDDVALWLGSVFGAGFFASTLSVASVVLLAGPAGVDVAPLPFVRNFGFCCAGFGLLLILGVYGGANIVMALTMMIAYLAYVLTVYFECAPQSPASAAGRESLLSYVEMQRPSIAASETASRVRSAYEAADWSEMQRPGDAASEIATCGRSASEAADGSDMQRPNLAAPEMDAHLRFASEAAEGSGPIGSSLGMSQADVGLPAAADRRLQAEASHGMCPDSAEEDECPVSSKKSAKKSSTLRVTWGIKTEELHRLSQDIRMTSNTVVEADEPRSSSTMGESAPSHAVIDRDNSASEAADPARPLFAAEQEFNTSRSVVAVASEPKTSTRTGKRVSFEVPSLGSEHRQSSSEPIEIHSSRVSCSGDGADKARSNSEWWFGGWGKPQGGSVTHDIPKATEVFSMASEVSLDSDLPESTLSLAGPSKEDAMSICSKSPVSQTRFGEKGIARNYCSEVSFKKLGRDRRSVMTTRFTHCGTRFPTIVLDHRRAGVTGKERLLHLFGWEPGGNIVDILRFILALPFRPFFVVTMVTPHWDGIANMLVPLGICAFLPLGNPLLNLYSEAPRELLASLWLFGALLSLLVGLHSRVAPGVYIKPLSFYCATFVTALCWCAIFSAELVESMRTLGFVLGIKPTMLGITLLAWANSLDPLMGTVSLAKAGEVPLAITGAYAGPLYNALFGTGLNLLILCFVGDGFVSLSMTPCARVLVGGAQGVLLLTAVVTIMSNWKMTRRLGICLAFSYPLLLAGGLALEFSRSDWQEDT